MKKIILIFIFCVVIISAANAKEIIERGLTWNTYCNEYGECVLDSSTIPINYLKNDLYTPIIKTIVPSDYLDYNYEVESGVYYLYFKNNPLTIEYKIDDANIILQPSSLNYRDSLNTQQIKTIQTSNGFPIEHIPESEHKLSDSIDTFFYPNAFGNYTNLTYIYDNTELKLKLYVQSKNLPASTIITDAALDLDFIINYSSNLDLYINNRKWDGRTAIKTQSRIDFKIGDNIIFYIPAPKTCEKFHWNILAQLAGTDPHEKECTYGSYTLKKELDKIYLIQSTPYSFIINQDYLDPLEIDPSVVVSVDSTAADAWNNKTGTFDNDDSNYYLASNAEAGYTWGIFFRNITIPAGSTITESKLQTSVWRTCSVLFRCKYIIYGVDAVSPPIWASGIYEPKNAGKTSNSLGINSVLSDLINGVYALLNNTITSSVNEIITNSSWVSGSNLSLVGTDNASGIGAEIKLFTYESGYPAPRLSITYNNPPNVYLTLPENNTDINQRSIIFNCNGSFTNALVNISLYGNWGGTWHSNITNSTPVNNITTFNRTIAEGKYTWNCYGCDSSNTCGFASSNRTLYIFDITDPTIDLIAPTDTSTDTDGNVTFNCTITDNTFIQNISLYGNWSGGWHRNQTIFMPEVQANISEIVLLMHMNNLSQFKENDTYIYDFSGNENNGTINITPYINTLFNKGLNFTKLIGQKVTIQDSPVLDGFGYASWSVWIKPSQLISGECMAIGSKRYAYNLNNSWGFGFGFNNDPFFNFELGSTGVNNKVNKISWTNFTANRWTHLAITYNKTAAQNVRIYINGTEITLGQQQDLDADINNSIEPMKIGTVNYNDLCTFNGSIDEFVIYNRTLNSTEVLALYNNAKTPYTANFTVYNIPNGNYKWNCEAYDVYNWYAMNNTNWTFTSSTNCWIYDSIAKLLTIPNGCLFSTTSLQIT